MDEARISSKLINHGLAEDDVERALEALRTGGALARVTSAHVPPATRPYVGLRDADGLTLAYVHKNFVDIRSEFAPDNAVEVEHYSGIHRVAFPGFRDVGGREATEESGPLENCPEHFVPTNPDGSCDFCEP